MSGIKVCLLQESHEMRVHCDLYLETRKTLWFGFGRELLSVSIQSQY